MRLKRVLVADPVPEVAALIAAQCEPMAEQCCTVTSAAEVLAKGLALRPDVLIISLDFDEPPAQLIFKTLSRELPHALLLATFRELSVPTMETLAQAGVSDFLGQPVDAVKIYRAASERFDMFLRRHPRYDVAVAFSRTDGTPLGTTIDLSEGGMMFHSSEPIQDNESLLVDLHLGGNDGDGDGDGVVRVRCQMLEVFREDETLRARGQFINLRSTHHRRLATFLADLQKVA